MVRELKYRAVWVVSTQLGRVSHFIARTNPKSYNVAHKLLTTASRRGRVGWVEEVHSNG